MGGRSARGQSAKVALAESRAGIVLHNGGQEFDVPCVRAEEGRAVAQDEPRIRCTARQLVSRQRQDQVSVVHGAHVALREGSDLSNTMNCDAPEKETQEVGMHRLGV